MKYLLTLSLLTLIGCGGEPQQNDMTATIGEVRALSADDNLTDIEKNGFVDICQALDAQKDYLDQFIVNTNKTIQLSAGVANCGQTTPTFSTLNEKVTSSGGELSMTGAPFKDVLTTNSALIKEFCAKTIADASQQLARGFSVGSRARWFSVYKGQDEKCNGPNGSKDEMCIKMETGVKNTENANSYIIQDVEVFKVSIKTNEDKYGMVVDRTLATSVTCSQKGDKYYKGQRFVQYNL